MFFDLFAEGNILVAMANAVEKADAILVCVSRSYKASVHCQTGEIIMCHESIRCRFYLAYELNLNLSVRKIVYCQIQRNPV